MEAKNFYKWYQNFVTFLTTAFGLILLTVQVIEIFKTKEVDIQANLEITTYYLPGELVKSLQKQQTFGHQASEIDFNTSIEAPKKTVDGLNKVIDLADSAYQLASNMATLLDQSTFMNILTITNKGKKPLEEVRIEINDKGYYGIYKFDKTTNYGRFDGLINVGTISPSTTYKIVFWVNYSTIQYDIEKNLILISKEGSHPVKMAKSVSNSFFLILVDMWEETPGKWFIAFVTAFICTIIFSAGHDIGIYLYKIKLQKEEEQKQKSITEAANINNSGNQ